MYPTFVHTSGCRWLAGALTLAVLAAGETLAVPVAPGGTATVSGTTVAQRPELAGTVLYDELVPFAIVGPGGARYAANLQNRVVRLNVTGTLTFEYRVRDPEPGLDGVLNSLQTTGMTGRVIDVDYRKDGLGDAGPDTISRSADGTEITMQFTTNPISGSLESRFMLVFTDATDFEMGGQTTVALSTGESVTFPTVTPVAGASRLLFLDTFSDDTTGNPPNGPEIGQYAQIQGQHTVFESGWGGNHRLRASTGPNATGGVIVCEPIAFPGCAVVTYLFLIEAGAAPSGMNAFTQGLVLRPVGNNLHLYWGDDYLVHVRIFGADGHDEIIPTSFSWDYGVEYHVEWIVNAASDTFSLTINDTPLFANQAAGIDFDDLWHFAHSWPTFSTTGSEVTDNVVIAANDADCGPIDECPDDPDKTEPGVCGCGVPDDLDTDADGTPDCVDECPVDAVKTEAGVCGCGVSDDFDTDGDGTPDCIDECSDDPNKTEPGLCGCGASDADEDGDGFPDGCDSEECPGDPNKTEPGQCGCGVADTDTDGDGVADCNDWCPDDPNKTEPGVCGCGTPDTDDNGNGVPDCIENWICDDGTLPGLCGCGIPDTDGDNDGVPDCMDACPDTPPQTPVDPSGCSWCWLIDSDNDGVDDCMDECAGTPPDTSVDQFGCPWVDSDDDGVPDSMDQCPDTPPGTQVDPLGCPWCWANDSDNDGVDDCLDQCHDTPPDTRVDQFGCPWVDSDNDGVPDNLDLCPDTSEGDPVNAVGCTCVTPCCPTSMMTLTLTAFGLLAVRLTGSRRREY